MKISYKILRDDFQNFKGRLPDNGIGRHRAGIRDPEVIYVNHRIEEGS